MCILNLSIAMRHGLLPALALFLQPWLFLFSNTAATGISGVGGGGGGGGGGGDAFVVCLMAVFTYMKLLHILAESGPEKKYLAFAVWSM